MERNDASYYKARIEHCREQAEKSDNPQIKELNESFIRLYQQRLDAASVEGKRL